jgi:hypothetical protein
LPTVTGTGVGAKNTVSLSSNTTYTLVMYGKDSTAADVSMRVGRSENGSTNTDCSGNQAVLTTGFTVLTCTFTTGTTSGSTYIYVRDLLSRNTSTAYYIDSAQLFVGSGGAVNAFQNGTIALNGVINSPLLIKNQADSVAALQIQNASGTAFLSVNSINGSLTQSFAAPTFVGGGDASGTTNSGTGNSAYNSEVTAGKYLYAVKAGSATNCNTAGNKVGCELQIWDVSNPAAPTFVGGGDSSGTANSGTGAISFNSVAVSGRYAYIALNGSSTNCNTAGDKSGCELQIWDVSNPAAPAFVGGGDVSGATNSGTGGNVTPFNSVYVSGRYAYIGSFSNATNCSTAGDKSGCELQIWDISNPAAPTFVGGGDSSGNTNSGTGINSISSIVVSGRYAYVANGGSIATNCSTAGDKSGCELQIWDVSNPAAPTFSGGGDSTGTTNSGTGSTGFNSIAVSGRYAYIAASGSATDCSTAGDKSGCELQIWDVSNPAAPAFSGGGDSTGTTNSGTGGNASPFKKIAISGRYAYIAANLNSSDCSMANYKIGCELQVWDTSTPSAPTFAGGADSTGTNNGNFSGHLNSIFVSGRYAYTATAGDATNCASVSNKYGCEVQVWDISGMETTSLLAHSLEAGTLTVDAGGNIAGDLSVQGGLSIGQSANINGDLSVGGSASFRNKTNSAAAFQIQNAVGSNALLVGTTGLNTLIANGSIEGSDNSNWANKTGTTTQAQTSAQSYTGNYSEQAVFNSSATSDGVKYVFSNGALSAITTYMVSFYLRENAGDSNLITTNLEVGFNSGSDSACTLSPTLASQAVPTTGWARYSCTIATDGSPTTSDFIYWQETDNPASTRTLYIDGLQLEQTSTVVSAFQESSLQLNGVITSPVAFRNASNSYTAFQVQDAVGTITLLNVDTVNDRVSVHNRLDVNGTSGYLSIYTTTTNLATDNAMIAFNSNRGELGYDGTTQTAVLRGGAGKGVTIQTNTSTSAASFASDGSVVFKNGTDSTAAFQVANQSGTALFNIDTNTDNANNLITNPSFETATMWTAKNGSGASATSQVATPVYDGTKAMQITTSSTATNAGASFSTSLTLNATYVLSTYVKAATTNFSTFSMGYTNTGGDNDCITTQTVVLSGWSRITCSFTVTTTAGTAIYVKQSDATGRTYYIDAVLLETDANASGYYENGQISLQGAINSPVVLQNTTNSANAFLVQNSSGSNIFGVDTTDTNLVTNPGVEVNTTSWAGKSTATAPTISRDTSSSYLGYAGLKVVTGTTVQDGVKYTFPNNTTLLANTQYTLSFYAKISASSIATFSFGRSDTGVSAGETSCITTGSLTTTWTRFSCNFTTGVTMGASGNPYVYMSQGTGVSSITFWVDAVSVEPGATATPYGAGSIYLNGVINSPVNFQNKTDSTSAFQIQNSASVALLGVDSANLRLQVGSATTDASAVLFTLDSYNQAGDPTNTVSGTMYYNTSTGKFRCYQGGAWANCISSTLSSYTILTSTTANSTYTVPSGVSTIMVELVGSGAAGGGGSGIASDTAGGGGGGAGGYAMKIVTGLAASYKYTVGIAGGAGAAGANAGGNGNQSCFGTNITACTTPIVSCNGGTGGTGSAANTTVATFAGGAGGTCTSGDVNITGSTGMKGSRASGTVGISGAGASTRFGSGGGSCLGLAAGEAATATAYGAGGGGGCTNSATNEAGGAGAQGVIIVWEFK